MKTKLLELFETEAGNRNLLNGELTVEKTYYLVRDMPYKRATNREPGTTIREWRGTCSGKHYLLKALLKDFGYESELIACTLYIPNEMAERVPPPLKTLFQQGLIPDVHNYLLLKLNSGEMLIDATWPKELSAFGLPLNEFVWGQNMRMAAKPIEKYIVPDDTDPQIFKEQLLAEKFTEDELKRRDLFFSALAV